MEVIESREYVTVGWDEAPPGQFEVGAYYTIASARLDWCDTVPQQIAAISDETVVWCGQNGIGEYLPGVGFHVPGLGLWVGQGTDDGIPVIECSDVLRITREAVKFDPSLEIAALRSLAAEIADEAPLTDPERGEQVDGAYIVRKLREIGGIAHFEVILAYQERLEAQLKLTKETP